MITQQIAATIGLSDSRNNNNKKDGYRQLNVRQLGSLRPRDHRGKCYTDRNSMLVKHLEACTHLSSTVFP